MPEITSNDLAEPGAGVRAQAVDKEGQLLQDFSIAETEETWEFIWVKNSPKEDQQPKSSSISLSDLRLPYRIRDHIIVFLSFLVERSVSAFGYSVATSIPYQDGEDIKTKFHGLSNDPSNIAEL